MASPLLLYFKTGFRVYPAELLLILEAEVFYPLKPVCTIPVPDHSHHDDSTFPHVAGEPYFREAGLKFLRSLKRNNRREWFEAHKPEFERELKQPMLALIETVNEAMEGFAPGHLRPPQKCMMRIYRDIRFSSDKRPYKSHISAWWSREGLEKTSGGGYYMHISPEEVLIAAGVYMPEREQLLAIRQHLLVHHAEVRQVLKDRNSSA